VSGFAGIGVDAGSTTCKVIAVGPAGEVAAARLEPAHPRIEVQVEEMLAALRAEAGDDVPCVATGYGRKLVRDADRQVTEITCHARGVFHDLRAPGTLIDVGGQDSKVVRIGHDGRPVDFVMNDKCAAGTGRFLEVMARALKLELEELGACALRASKAADISSTCAVFAESEVITLVAEGVARDEIVAGICRSIARRVGAMANRVGVEPPVAFAGGVAKNIGVVRALEEVLGQPLMVPEEPQIVGALGAALLARDGT